MLFNVHLIARDRVTYISHVIHLLEAGLQERLEGSTINGN